MPQKSLNTCIHAHTSQVESCPLAEGRFQSCVKGLIGTNISCSSYTNILHWRIVKYQTGSTHWIIWLQSIHYINIICYVLLCASANLTHRCLPCDHRLLIKGVGVMFTPSPQKFYISTDKINLKLISLPKKYFNSM